MSAKNNDLLSRLAEFDAAPRTEPTAADIDREERLLRTVLSDTGRPARTAGAAVRSYDGRPSPWPARSPSAWPWSP